MKNLILISFCFLVFMENLMAEDSFVDAKGQNHFTANSNISVGQKINIPEHRWVDAIVIKSFNGRRYIKMIRCGIQKGGQLIVRNRNVFFRAASVENLTEGREDRDLAGDCPKGAIFQIKLKELASFNERYAQIFQQERVRDELVETILSRSVEFPSQEVLNLSIGQRLDVPEEQLVNVVRAIYDSHVRMMLVVGDSCRIFKGRRELVILGFSPDSKLALVENLGEEGMVTGCPKGAMFLAEVEELASFDERYAQLLQEKRIKNELVETILDRSVEFPSQEVLNLSIGQELDIQKDQWVNVVWYSHNDSRSSKRWPVAEYRCRISKGIELRILGFSPDSKLALVESLQGLVAGCPKGAIFLIEVEKLANNKLAERILDGVIRFPLRAVQECLTSLLPR